MSFYKTEVLVTDGGQFIMMIKIRSKTFFLTKEGVLTPKEIAVKKLKGFKTKKQLKKEEGRIMKQVWAIMLTYN